jgi:hypothetical protein
VQQVWVQVWWEDMIMINEAVSEGASFGVFLAKIRFSCPFTSYSLTLVKTIIQEKSYNFYKPEAIWRWGTCKADEQLGENDNIHPSIQKIYQFTTSDSLIQ